MHDALLDRELFKAAMQRIGLDLPRSGYARSIEQAREVIRDVGYPAIIRPLAGSIANWMLQPPVSTPTARMMPMATSRIR